MKKIKLLTTIIFCFIFVSLNYAAEKVGMVEAIKGTGEALRETGFVILKIEDPIFEGDVLRTRANSTMKIKFNDGKIVFLAEKTKIKIDKYATKKEIMAERGGVRSIIDKPLLKDEGYVIKTTNAVAGVRGTDYAVIFIGDVMSVYVFTGLVNVSNDLGQVDVHKDFHLFVQLGQKPDKPIKTPSELSNMIKNLFNIQNPGQFDKLQELQNIQQIQEGVKRGIEKKQVVPPVNIPPSEINPKTIEPPHKPYHQPPFID